MNCSVCGGSGDCRQCVTGTYLLNGMCYAQCPAGTYSYNSVQPNNITIQTCRVDPCIHYIQSPTNSSVQCVICVSPYLLYNGQCVQNCPTGTYISQLQCIPCQSNCASCSDYSHCTKCVYPPYHYYNMQCLDNCPSGTYSYILPVNTTATTYLDGQCIPCPNSCLTCTTATNCQICTNGYYLSNNGSCVIICPQLYYANSDTNICSNCSSNCQICTNI